MSQSAENFVSEVGFEPTPRELDCDLNAAPWTARPSWHVSGFLRELHGLDIGNQF